MKKYDFCKMVGRDNLNTLRNDFGIDIQNLDVSENFKGQKYIKADMEQDLFLFFKKDILIGMLRGNKRNKSDNKFERYYGEFDGYGGTRLSRTNKNYTMVATDIVRIKKCNLNKLSRKENSGYYNRMNTPRRQLEKRLEEYKMNKYNSVTHEDIIKMSKEITSFISERLFYKIPMEYTKIKWYSINSYCELLEAFAKDINSYIIKYEKMKEYDTREYKGIFYKGEQKEYKSYKVEIIKWYKSLIK